MWSSKNYHPLHTAYLVSRSFMQAPHIQRPADGIDRPCCHGNPAAQSQPQDECNIGEAICAASIDISCRTVTHTTHTAARPIRHWNIECMDSVQRTAEMAFLHWNIMHYLGVVTLVTHNVATQIGKMYSIHTAVYEYQLLVTYIYVCV